MECRLKLLGLPVLEAFKANRASMTIWVLDCYKLKENMACAKQGEVQTIKKITEF